MPRLFLAAYRRRIEKTFIPLIPLFPLGGRMKTIKVSDETYRKLCEKAGRLQAELKRPVSIDETIRYLLEEKKKCGILELAGSWELKDDEAEEIFSSLRRWWGSWRTERSA
ncbi:MAG: antitoxin VapB family protein [Candidatus Jordarchaeales archaeon]